MSKNIFGICKHDKLSGIKGEYQYCTDCNKAFRVKHVCEFKNMEEYGLVGHYSGKVNGFLKMYTCKCGRVKTITCDKDGILITRFSK